MINHTSAVYTENKTKLLWSTILGVFYDENQKEQQRDRLYKCSIHKKMKLSCLDHSDEVRFVMKTKQDKDITNRISLVYAKNDTEQWDKFDQVQSVMKTQYDNDVTDCIGVVYIKAKTEISGSIGLGSINDKTRQDNDVTDLSHVVYIENETELSWPIKPSAVCHEN